MMLRSRSCVIGRGVAMFSIWRAMAFASKMPTQIGRTRSPVLVLEDHDGHVGDRIHHQPLDGHFDQHGRHPLRRIDARGVSVAASPHTLFGPARRMVTGTVRPIHASAPSPPRSEPENSRRCCPSSAPRLSPLPPPARRIHQDLDRGPDHLPRAAGSESPAAATAAPRYAPSSRSSLTSSGIRFDASVFGRGEYLNENMLWYCTASDQRQRLLEVLGRLAREANNHIGR